MRSSLPFLLLGGPIKTPLCWSGCLKILLLPSPPFCCCLPNPGREIEVGGRKVRGRDKRRERSVHTPHTEAYCLQPGREAPGVLQNECPGGANLQVTSARRGTP
ncbi:hypothetical protein DPEC_G00216800 [Dallia pectoralis]|uniref:Uncharacterized protein n=1 Tax=Dallia pectoralis TaxID=75939 RepID=A0ACC2G2E5_DALPE|nr:hypothetical protein DPEC_G00216800 [Dallia pectoralis]